MASFAVRFCSPILAIALTLLPVGFLVDVVETTGCSPATTQIVDSVVPGDVLADINCVTTELLQGGLSDPFAILAECGSLIMSQLIALAEDLLATPPISALDGGAISRPMKLLPAHYAHVILTDVQRTRIQTIHDAAFKLVDGGKGS